MKSIASPIKLLIFSLVTLMILSACERPSPSATETEQTDPAPAQPTTAPEVAPTIAPTVEIVAPEDTDVEESTSEDGAAVEDGAATGLDVETTVVPTDTTPSEPITEEQTHTVVDGDSLYRLSLIYGPSIAEIAAANNISETDTLEIGQTLTIPVPGTVAVAPPAEATAEPAEPVGERVHIVQAGENLFRIGLQYGFTFTELASYNGIANPHRLDVGQQIRIPANN